VAIEKQELHCHACNRYVQFEMDLSLNGNHVLNCPNCGHEHCRVVEDGRITDIRWDQRNGSYPTVYISANTVSSSYVSTFDTCTTGNSTTLYASWMNTTAVS